MSGSLRSLLLGIAIGVSLVAGSTVFAAGLPKGPDLRPGKKLPGTHRKPTVDLVPKGLRAKATVSPSRLQHQAVSMNVVRAPRIEATTNVVRMDKHTQLWLHFRAERGTDYDISCLFNGRKSVLTIDYAGNRALRQQTTTPAGNGRLEHKIFSRPKTEQVRVYMQARGDIDWRSCTVQPSS